MRSPSLVHKLRLRLDLLNQIIFDLERVSQLRQATCRLAIPMLEAEKGRIERCLAALQRVRSRNGAKRSRSSRPRH